MTRCRVPGCRRAPEYPDLAYCKEHLPKWTRHAVEERRVSPWVALAQQGRLTPKAF